MDELLPLLGGDLLITGLDGSSIPIHYKAPRYKVDAETGEKVLVNAENVTAPDAGFVPDSAGKDKSGDGYKLFTVATSRGEPLVFDVTALNDPETETALRLYQSERWAKVRKYIPDGKAILASADAGLHSQPLREEMHRQGVVESIHLASHSNSPTTRKAVAERDKQIFSIEGYPNWYVNGHRELKCKCGKGRVSKDIDVSNGVVTVRMDGRCKNCKGCTITAGKWRTAQNPSRFVLALPDEEADWSFGNPLTYNDLLSRQYGTKRFAYHEGFYGALESRFGLIKHKRWFRRRNTALLETLIVFCVIHALSIEQRRMEAAAAALGATGPPGAPPPAGVP